MCVARIKMSLNSLSWPVRTTGESGLCSLHPISLQDTTLKEYWVKGSTTSSPLTLYMKELPLVISVLAVRLVTSVKFPLLLTSHMYTMKPSTGLFPSKVEVHLKAIQREPVLKAVTSSGGSGRSGRRHPRT